MTPIVTVTDDDTGAKFIQKRLRWRGFQPRVHPLLVGDAYQDAGKRQATVCQLCHITLSSHRISF